MGEERNKKMALLKAAAANGIPIVRAPAILPLPQPLADYVVVRRRRAAEMTAGGLFIPNMMQTAEAADEQGGMRVLAVGPLVTRCKVGDEIVTVQQSAGDKSNVMYGGTNDALFILPESSVIAVMPASDPAQAEVGDQAQAH